ncbi:MAG TPA: peptidylprolyl isomerase [Terrimicrobiaceae bacterium]
MKIFLATVAIILTAFEVGLTATVGPEVAVMQIKIGKEREFQQVVIGLYDGAAPATVENFKELCRRKFYKGMRFHRAFPSTLVQTGDPKSRRGVADRSGTGGPGYTVPSEIGRNHVRGAVAMARLPDLVNPSKASNGSQFYVCLTSLPKLDGKYTVFGEVLEGLDVLDMISNQPTDSNDFPVAKIVIKSITIQPRFAEVASP